MSVAAVGVPAAMAREPEDLENLLVRKLDEIATTINRKPPIPQWLIPLLMWSVLQLVGSIWWAATIQAKQELCLTAIEETKGRVNVLEMRANNGDATFGEKVRGKVRETIDDLDLIRIRRIGDD